LTTIPHINLSDLFLRIGFIANKDLKKVDITIKKDKKLTAKLKDKTYIYNNENSRQAKTSFYLIDVPDLTEPEIEKIHARIWNKGDADLFIYSQNNTIRINYVQTLPKNMVTVADIPINKKDDELLEQISKHHFDTGAFWLLHQEKLKNVTRQTVDNALVKTLRFLRKKLQDEYQDKPENERDELVQALIDRTLFIKFLEDKYITNSYFYEHTLKKDTDYKKLLLNRDNKKINQLFGEINNIFNNHLFKTPQIPDKELKPNVLTWLYRAVSGTNFETGQLSLFDFQFDIIPIEFISHIYQIFLEEEESNTSHFTPEGLVKLVVEDTINDAVGTTLDPACGSGIFLVVALRRMIKNAKISDTDIHKLITKKNKFLADYIFGIEIQPIAVRLAYFSLYLELLNGIEASDLKALIKSKIKKADFKLFPYSFEKNILCQNTLDIENQPFEGEQFDFIVGNPPWGKVSPDSKGEKYWFKFQENFSRAKQISECFLHKVDDWKKESTQFGIVVNSSNFTIENKKFQNYFYNNYDIKKIYELSEINSILFLKAGEPAITLIFKSHENENNIIEFIKPELNEFSKKFHVVLLKNEDIRHIPQKDLLDDKTIRDFTSNEYDSVFVKQLKLNRKVLSDFLIKNPLYTSMRGMQTIGKDSVCKEFDITEDKWRTMSIGKKKFYREKFSEKYIRTKPHKKYNIPFFEYSDIEVFGVKQARTYLNPDDITKFERPRNTFLYEGNKILFPRLGNNARAYLTDKLIYFSSNVFSVKLENNTLYPVITAILNSTFINYYFTVKNRKRQDVSFPIINMNDLKNVPIPLELSDNDPTTKAINKISKNIISGKIKYEDCRAELDEYIYDLYDLNLVERNRINDFFIDKNEIVKRENIEEYCNVFERVTRFHLKKGVYLKFEYFITKSLPIDFVGVKISFVKRKPSQRNVEIDDVVKYLNHDMLTQIGNRNILTLKERIYGDNAIYIIKDSRLRSWTKTKAYEDAQIEILKVQQPKYDV